MITRLFFISALLILSLTAQERVLLHINKEGQQEAFPLKKGERAQDVIERLEHAKASSTKNNSPTGLIDTLKYWGTINDLTTSFSYSHQDVAMQWYVPAELGRVKEFWWHNYTTTGYVSKATIRAWRVNPNVTNRPTNIQVKYLGYYSDPTDGDGLKSPFKPATGNTWFYSNGAADSATWNFDPLGTEVQTWLPGSGLQVNLKAGVWQGIQLESWGDSMVVAQGQPFGFTFSDDTKKSDYGSGTDTAMLILAAPNNNPAPMHSYKYYENGRLVTTTPTDGGWWMRGDYDWGFYVVVEYSSCRPPKFVFSSPYYNTTLSSKPRDLCFVIQAGYCNALPVDSAKCVTLVYKIGSLRNYDTLKYCSSDWKFCIQLPGASPGDTVYWDIFLKDLNGNRISYGVRTYKIFKKSHDRLLIYNNNQYSMGNASLIYTSSSNKYDRWSIPTDGIDELDTLFSLYDKILVVDGSFPNRNVYSALNKWLGSGTATAKKSLFFTSQDYGCYIQSACADTTFLGGSFEEKYLGISKLGPQDQGPTNRPIKMVPQADTITNYIIKYNADSVTTLWYYPTFELAFAAYPDFFTPTASAKPLFKDGTEKNVYGVRNSGTNFNAMFLAFDAGSLEFRGDTSLHSADYRSVTDPKYRWIVDVKSLANSFFDVVTDVKQTGTDAPLMYSLSQNYPNPFNPSTTIEYSVANRSNVKIVIYNILGQKVATVVNETKDAGIHTATFNAQSLASGLYFYEMRSGSFVNVKKMLLMK